jgi:hypothetical protein
LSIGKPAATSSIPRSNSSFSTVRRIFRSRSKSVSIPNNRRSVLPDPISEADEFGRADAAEASPVPQRERKTSFFFNRSKLHKGDAKKASTMEDPLVLIRGQESPQRGSIDSVVTQSTSATTPPAIESSTSEYPGLPSFVGMGSNADRSLTLQAIESASPYGIRRPSPALRTPSREQGDGEQDGSRIVTPTPARRAMNGLSEGDEGTGVAYSTTTPSQKGSSPAPRASVPKMWQMQASDGEESHDRSYSRQVTASATSGSMSSYRTATSTPRPTSPSQVPKSPLSDLIFNLEKRLSSPRMNERNFSSSNADTPRQQALAYIPPFRTIRRLEDDNLSLPSSSSSYTIERSPHGIMAASAQPEIDSTPIARRSRVGDISMSDIEDSVAAVEAALQDHSIAGSFDPSQLRKKMVNARHVSMMGSEIVNEEDLQDFEMLSQSPGIRIRIPPELEHSIRGSIMEVKRALSSSHLPLIPNEDDAVSEYSHGHTLRPGATNASAIESTPARAARGRQESMQDVEAAYARMIDLVGTAAGMDLNATSPMAYTNSLSPRAVQPTALAPFSASGSGNLTYPAPRQASHGHSQSVIVPSTMNRSARQQLLRDSDNLARLHASRETDEPVLRGRASSMSLGSRRAISESPPARQQRMAANGINMNISPAQLQQLQKAGAKRVSIEQPAGSSAHGSGAGTAMGTSPSVTVKTQGTPRSIEMEPIPSHAQQIHEWNSHRYSASPSSVRPILSMTQNKSSTDSSNVFTGIDARMMEEQRRRNRALVGAMPSSPRQTASSSHQRQSSVLRDFPQMDDTTFRPQSGASDYSIAMQQRHALERDSLLDMLNRSRSEANALMTRTRHLEADLHQEVTRVLELQREIHRQRESEQMMRQNEQAMQQRIASLEAELKHEHDDRLRIAELLERVQMAVDNATKTDAGHNPVRGSAFLTNDMLSNGQEGWTSTHPDTYRGESLLDSSVDASDSYAERRSPSLRSYPSVLGLDGDDQEMSWSLDKEEMPLDDGEQHSSSSHPADTRATESVPVEPASLPVSPRPSGIPTMKRFSQPATSRLPVLTSPQSTSASSFQPVAANSSSVSSRSSLASRFGGGSMIGKPRISTGVASSSSSTPQSIRNLSTSSSTGRYAGLPAPVASPSARKASAATTAGDTSFTARTPDTADVTRLSDLGNDSSFT